MKILHAASYSFTRNGSEYFNCEYKFHNGFVRAGHYVYPFSINDCARNSNLLRTKVLGKAAANRGLIECCRNIEPDFLVLGHAQYITPETLKTLRTTHPVMKIACWYVDPIYPPHPFEHLLEKLPYLDALFITTAGDLLRQFEAFNNSDGETNSCRTGFSGIPESLCSRTATRSRIRDACPTKSFKQSACRVAFIPNPADINIERWKVDEQTETRYDLVYIGSDKNRPERQAFLVELDSLTGGLRTGFAACLGRPPVWGAQKDAMLKGTLTALNLSDRNDVFLYSSDRIVQLAGNGICTFSAAATGLDALYESGKEMAFFSDVKDLAEKIRYYAAHPDEARAIGRAGRIKTHAAYSGHAIADFMCAFTFDEPRWKNFAWAKFCS
jgi:hypothetical protein